MTQVKKNKVNLGTGSIPKLLVRLALPAVVAQIINMLYNLIDRIYVGGIKEYGTEALAALGVCFPILLIVAAFSALVGMGGAPIASIRLGENKREDAEKTLNAGAVMLFFLGIVLTVVLLIFSKDLLILFGCPSSSLSYADQYLKIYAIGTMFVMFSLGLNNFISAQGFALTSMITVAVGAVLNIILDPIFIFALNMGVKGAALATIISQGVSCLWVLSFFFGKKTMLKIRPKLFSLKPKYILPILALGIAPFIMQSTESAVQVFFNIQISKYSGGNAVYTAALAVMTSVMQMIVLPLNGLGMGAQPLISYNYGAGKIDRVKKAIKYVFIVALICCIIVWSSGIFFPQVYAKIFSASPEVTQVVKNYMPFFMMGTIFFCSQFALQSAFLALGQAKISMFLALLRKVILLIPFMLIFPLFMEIQGIFMAEGIADILAGTTTTLVFMLSIKKILRKRLDKINNENAVTSDKLQSFDTILSAETFNLVESNLSEKNVESTETVSFTDTVSSAETRHIDNET